MFINKPNTPTILLCTICCAHFFFAPFKTGLFVINIFDDNDQIKSKIMKAKTDNTANLSENLDNRPEIMNLIKIFGAFTDKNSQIIINKYNDLGNKKFKTDLAEVIISKLEPIRNEALKILDNKTDLENIFINNSEKASEIADGNIKEIKKIIGIN